MAYNTNLAKVYNQIKELKDGNYIHMTKDVANKNGFYTCDDLAEWASKINDKVLVRYIAKGSLFAIYMAPDKLGRLKKIMSQAKVNYPYSTICSPEEVKQAFAEANLGGKLVIWTGLATYFEIKK